LTSNGRLEKRTFRDCGKESDFGGKADMDQLIQAGLLAFELGDHSIPGFGGDCQFDGVEYSVAQSAN
jgi:hypothetical protein